MLSQTMKAKQKHSTAEATAAMRAAQILYHQPVVFNDPFALQLTSSALRRACQNRFIGWLLQRHPEPACRGSS
jgi:O-methyltransferase involved in polyketide biosynthesis